MIINHNIQAMNSLRQFNIVNNNQKKVMERLSSGYRINRASDDAAGLAISEKMRSQIRGLNQGAVNVQDGISLCQVADGALDEVHNMLQRITELSVQASNGTNTESDRDNIQDEVEELIQEINRVSETTEFNKKPLFCGKMKTMSAINNTVIATVADASVDRVKSINKSLSMTGTPTGYTGVVYQINKIEANDTQITIDGDAIDWSQVKNASGGSIADGTIAEASYSFQYKGITFSFKAPANSTKDDVCQAINGTTFRIETGTNKHSPVTLSSVSMVKGTQTENILGTQSNWKKLGSSTPYLNVNVIADANGISIEGYGSKSWAQLGVSNFGNGVDKSFTFSDTQSGISFSGVIEGTATADEVYSSLTCPLKLSSAHVKNNTVTETKAASNEYRNFKITGLRAVENSVCDYPNTVKNSIYAALGYTEISDQLNDLSVTVSLVPDSTQPHLMAARITDDATGNYFDLKYDGSDYVIFDSSPNYIRLYFRGAQGTITVGAKRSISLNGDAQNLFDYISNVGEIGKASITSPFSLSINTVKSVSDNVYYANNLRKPTVADNGNVLPPSQDDTEEESTEVQDIWIQAGANQNQGMTLSIEKTNARTLGVEALNINTFSGAQEAIRKANEAINAVSKLRSKIGAFQNRLEHTFDIDTNSAENLQSAESKIRDADFANEVVQNAKNNILIQAGQNMIVQANQSKESILQLIQG